MYFDSHAHLTEDCFAQDFDTIVENMKTASVTGMMEIGYDLPSSEKAVQLAEQLSWVHAAVGSHPDDAAQVDEARIAVYRELCKNPRVKAIGEIGLDYHWDDTPHDIQQFWFREQIRLAEKLQMPIAIHDREAHGDVFKILEEENAFDNIKILFHCFSGSGEFARQLTDRGCYLSLAGPITYNTNRKAKAVLSVVPEDRLLVETDSPYLTPVPHRGERNDSSYIVYTIQKAAEYLGKTFEETADLTYRNAVSFFGIDEAE